MASQDETDKQVEMWKVKRVSFKTPAVLLEGESARAGAAAKNEIAHARNAALQVGVCESVCGCAHIVNQCPQHLTNTNTTQQLIKGLDIARGNGTSMVRACACCCCVVAAGFALRGSHTNDTL
jgi:hypothetical protein